MAAENRRALVIEDDEGASELMKAILEREGWEVRQAFDGKAGVVLAGEFLPGLVVVDLMLPRMHGFEVCERLRENESSRSVKILVASAKSYTQDIDGAKEAGADAYLTKPIDLDAFSAKVRELTGKANGAAGTPASSNPTTPI